MNARIFLRLKKAFCDRALLAHLAKNKENRTKVLKRRRKMLSGRNKNDEYDDFILWSVIASIQFRNLFVYSHFTCTYVYNILQLM